MRGKLIVIMVMLSFVLVACGGNKTEDTGPTPTPMTPTPEPPLEIEERIQYSAGLPENHLRMIIRPVDTVAERLNLILAYELGVDVDDITPDSNLRDDLGAEDLLLLNHALSRDFGVTIGYVEADEISTVDDLVKYIHFHLGNLVSRELFDRSSLFIDVITVDSYGVGHSELCESSSGIVAIPWLNAPTYVAAVAQACGEPAMQVAVASERAAEFVAVDADATPEPEMTEETMVEATVEVTSGATSEATAEVTPEMTEEAIEETVENTATPEPTSAVETPSPEEEVVMIEFSGDMSVGTAGLIIADPELGGVDIQMIRGRVFCRLGYDDFYSWFVPALLMEAREIDPNRDPLSVIDYPNNAELVEAVENGDCAAAGISEADYAAFRDTTEVNIIETTVALPYGILMYPLEVEFGVRASLNEHIIALSQDSVASRPLRLLLGHDVIIPAEVSDFTELDEFMESAGYDFGQLGN